MYNYQTVLTEIQTLYFYLNKKMLKTRMLKPEIYNIHRFLNANS